MKHTALALLLAITALAAPQLRAQDELSFDYFYEFLLPHGDWIDVADYGYCWQPRGVGEDWAPYTDGYWAYTDGGWTWVSYEDWGGITYHYGRWVRLEEAGWAWVPDYEWAPAWVSWRSNDEYIGWAPLPPEAQFEPETGFSVWVDTSYDIGPDYYNFCRIRDFGSPVLAPVCLPRVQNVVIIRNTINITNVTFNTHHRVIFCGGPNFVIINKACARPIPALQLVRDLIALPRVNGRFAPQNVRGNQLAVFAPKLVRPANPRAIAVQPVKVIPAGRINRGWAHVPDPATRLQIKQHFAQQHGNLTPKTAPARPMKPQDVEAVPVKGNPNAPSPVVVVKPKRPALPDADGTGRPVPPRPDVVTTPPPRPNPVADNRPRPDKPPVIAPPPVLPPVGQPMPPVVERPNRPATGNDFNGRPPLPGTQPPRPIPTEKPIPVAPPIPTRPAIQQPAQDDAAQAARKAQRDQAVAQQALENARRQQVQQQQVEVQRQQQENASRAAAAQRQQQATQQANEMRRAQQQQAQQRQPQVQAQPQPQQPAPRQQPQRQAEPQRQSQPPPQAQPQAPQRGNGGGNQRTPEEAAALKRQGRN